MNGNVKFHKANGPAFNPGEVWVSSSGCKCQIDSVRKFGDDKWDYEVTCVYPDGAKFSKDAWNFQVRYQHVADANV
jgi:hypothetical protein